jgi:hypothetical protein
VATHWIVSSVVLNSPMRWSMATLTTVMSSIAMTAPRTTTDPMARILRSSFSEPGPPADVVDGMASVTNFPL